VPIVRVFDVRGSANAPGGRGFFNSDDPVVIVLRSQVTATAAVVILASLGFGQTWTSLHIFRQRYIIPEGAIEMLHGWNIPDP